MPGATKVFDSAQIPGEIIDLMVVNTEMLKDNPELGKALAGAWYETMALMTGSDDAGKATRDRDGQGLRHRPRGLRGAARDDADVLRRRPRRSTFTSSPELPTTMDNVRKFSFEHGLLGEGATTADVVGIELPGGKMLGDAKQREAALRRRAT